MVCLQSILSNRKMDAISIATKYQEDDSKSEKYQYTHLKTYDSKSKKPYFTDLNYDVKG